MVFHENETSNKDVAEFEANPIIFCHHVIDQIDKKKHEIFTKKTIHFAIIRFNVHGQCVQFTFVNTLFVVPSRGNIRVNKFLNDLFIRIVNFPR